MSLAKEIQILCLGLRHHEPRRRQRSLCLILQMVSGHPMCHWILRDLSLGFVILHVSSPHVAISLLLSSRVEFRSSFFILSSTRQCKQGITLLRNAMEERVQNLKQLRKNQTSNRTCLLASDTAVVPSNAPEEISTQYIGPQEQPSFYSKPSEVLRCT